MSSLKKLKTSSILMLIVVLSACNPKNEIGAQTEDTPLLFEVYSHTPPIVLTTEIKTFYQDIPYDIYEKNTFDLFIPKSNTPTSLVIFYHAGGFLGGNKSDVYGNPSFINALLANNVAFASVNYRLLGNSDADNILTCLNDSKRALQFIKYYNTEFNLTKNNVIIMGNSAGAGTSLWLGLHDNMAEPSSDDPVLRESTRVQGIIARSAQSSYDLMEWPYVTFKNYMPEGMDFETVVSLIGENRILQFYNIQSIDDLNSYAVIKDRIELDMLTHMTYDDPKIYIISNGIPNAFPTTSNEIIHHPQHAKAILDKALENDINCQAYIPEMDIDTTKSESILDFIFRLLP